MSYDLDPDELAVQEAAKEARQKEVDDVEWMLGHPSGRRFMWRLLDEAGVYRTSFNNSGSVTAFNEGKRQIGLVFLAEIMAVAPQQFTAMLKERTNT